MAVLEEPIQQPRIVRNFVNGEWVTPRGESVEITNPATGAVIGALTASGEDDLNAAVAAAKEAFWEWRTTPPVARARHLFRLKQLLEEHFEELSRIQSQEHGKTIDESRGETRRGIENVEVACGIPTLQMGQVLEDVTADVDEYVIRQPLGVFGIVAPFNFPFMIPLWSAPYAVATGNCVVIKPSPEVPLTQMRLAELVEEANFPPGVWNVVNGGAPVVSGMLSNPDVVGVTFVGSTSTAKLVYEGCGKSGKRVIAQAGAKNFMVVMPDCNVEKTIPALLSSFFGNTGQRCLAGANLVIVGRDDHFFHNFVERVAEAARRIVTGYGLDESVQMGPVRDRTKRDRIIRYIEIGIEEGANLVLDGRRINIRGPYPENCFVGPTIFTEVTPAMRIAQEEIFGPVMGVFRAKDLDEAITLCNSGRFGNGNAIFTSSGGAAREFRYRVRSGNVGVNVGIVAPMAFFPFGGMNDSFFGVLHSQGQEAVRFFTESKVVIERWF